MLVLTRKPNEQIRIGDSITISVIRMKGNAVSIGIEAPRDVRVLRGELMPREMPSPTPADAPRGADSARREEAQIGSSNSEGLTGEAVIPGRSLRMIVENVLALHAV